MLHAVVLRSPVAHGRIRSIDASAARAMPGVHAVMTAADIGEVPVIPLRLANLPEFKDYLQPVIAQRQGALCRRAAGGGGRGDARRWPRTRWRRSKSTSSGCRRCRTGTPRHRDQSLLFEATGSNRAVRYAATFGDADAAFAKAEYTRKENFRCHRLTGLPLETRGQIAEWDAAK